MGAPHLLHNISAPSYSTKIIVCASPFGSRQPVIPTARSVTVARVASPISMDRAYQPLFLLSLKAYFNFTKRLVKQGDLVAIGLDTDSVGRICNPDPSSDDPTDPQALDIFDQ